MMEALRHADSRKGPIVIETSYSRSRAALPIVL